MVIEDGEGVGEAITNGEEAEEDEVEVAEVNRISMLRLNHEPQGT